MGENVSLGNRFPNTEVFGILHSFVGELGVESGVER